MEPDGQEATQVPQPLQSASLMRPSSVGQKVMAVYGHSGMQDLQPLHSASTM